MEEEHGNDVRAREWGRVYQKDVFCMLYREFLREALLLRSPAQNLCKMVLINFLSQIKSMRPHLYLRDSHQLMLAGGEVGPLFNGVVPDKFLQ